jgi:hypothetical protein
MKTNQVFLYINVLRTCYFTLFNKKDMSNKYKYPVVFTGAEKNKLDNLKGFSKIGYKSELIAKHIIEQNPSITSCSFIRGKKNMYLGDVKVRMQGYKKDQARYIEVKTGTLYEGRKKLCIDYKYTIKNCPDKEYRQSTTEPWINASYDIIAIVFSDVMYMIRDGCNLLEKVQQDVDLKRLQSPSLDDDWYTIRDVEISNGLVATTNQVHTKYDTWLLSLDLDTYLDRNNIQYKRIAYEIVQRKRVE